MPLLMRRFAGAFVIGLLLVAPLAGCGGEDTGGSASAERTTEMEQATAVPRDSVEPSNTDAPTATPQPVDEPASSAVVPSSSGQATDVTTAPSDTQTATAGAAYALELVPVADGLDAPVHAAHAGDGSGRIFVVEKQGRIRVIADGELRSDPFLDITDVVGSNGSEQGLLSVAFHPEFRSNGYFYVNYTDSAGDTVIARYEAPSGENNVDPASAKVLLTIDQPFPNHNGGQVAFGPDGYLYIGMGDGGGAGDPLENGQNLSSLLGKLLRIDVDGGDPYAIPGDNPFVNQADARPEIWAIGLRNPWRFSFDRSTGDLFIADVGQGAREEVHFQPADNDAPLNYGWNTLEGSRCFESSDCDQAGLELPVGEYTHEFGCTIVGGFRYRGERVPAFGESYFFADYCSGLIWALDEDTQGAWQQRELLTVDMSISSFGEDEQGELYLTDLRSGGLYRLEAAE